MKIFFDGGCRPNPGTMEIAVVAGGATRRWPDIGQGSSEEAEWLALLQAVSVASELRSDDIVLIGDSMSIIAQASRKAVVRGPFRVHLAEFEAATDEFSRVRLRHVTRHQNLAGIALQQARHGLHDK